MISLKTCLNHAVMFLMLVMASFMSDFLLLVLYFSLHINLPFPLAVAKAHHQKLVGVMMTNTKGSITVIHIITEKVDDNTYNHLTNE